MIGAYVVGGKYYNPLVSIFLGHRVSSNGLYFWLPFFVYLGMHSSRVIEETVKAFCGLKGDIKQGGDSSLITLFTGNILAFGDEAVS